MEIANLLTVVFGIAAVVGGGLAGLLYGGLRTLRDTASDLRLRVSDLEKERAEDKARIDTLEANEEENKILKSMVTGKVEWGAISDQLENHHRETLGFWQRAEQHLEKIESALENP